MKCISKIFKIVITCSLCLSLIGCGSTAKDSVASYDIYNTSFVYGITNYGAKSDIKLFSDGLCVANRDDLGTSNVHSQVAQAGGAFNVTEQTVVYSQNMHEKMYPASTTKILTAYIACLYGDLDSYVTVSGNACKQESDSSVIDLKPGDVMSLRDLLYGMLLRSGNDASVAIAEAISGSEEEFAVKMNETARAIGATNSNFVTSNGLHDDNHYTTVYDMYLILNTAIKNEEFYKIFTSTSYTCNYTSGGEPKTVEWSTTNQYLTNNVTTPSGFTILGGKTGTTGAAGYCLVLLSENEENDTIISIVFNADCRSNLYLLMSEILSNYCV